MQLAVAGYVAQVPEMPTPYAPVYEEWLGVLAQFAVNEETALIGHSLGAGFLARWLSENKVKVGKLAFVAPFLDPDEDEVPSGFFDFDLDLKLAARTQGVRMFWDPEDDAEILESVERLKAIENIELLELPGKGHFTKYDRGGGGVSGVAGMAT